MKKSIFLLLLATLVGMAALAQSETGTIEPFREVKARPYIIPKLELAGPIVQAAMLPSRIYPGFRNTFNPLPIAASVEVEIGRKSSAILGLGFRYGKNEAWFPSTEPSFWTGKFSVFRILVGYRHYFEQRNGLGFYTQPTAKVTSGRTTQFHRDVTESTMNVNFLVTNRIGLQLKLWRGLVLDAALGLGFGFQSQETFSRYNWGYYYNTPMDEVGFLDTQIYWGWGRTPTISVIGDGSLAMGWRF